MKSVIKILFDKKINKILSYVFFINLFIYIIIDVIFNWVSLSLDTEIWLFLLQAVVWLIIIISIFIFLIYNKFYKTFGILILFIVLLSSLPFIDDGCNICSKLEEIIGFIFGKYLSPLHNFHISH